MDDIAVENNKDDVCYVCLTPILDDGIISGDNVVCIDCTYIMYETMGWSTLDLPKK